MKKPLIIAAAVGALLIATVLALLLRGGAEPAEVSPTPSAASMSTATPSAEPEEHLHDGGKGGFDAKEREVEANPLLKDLPRHTAFWFLTFEGTQGNKYLLNAMVFYRPGENPQTKLDEQKPRIESFIRDTGQAAGTYVINYTTRLVGTD